jgi:hypothetical protein
VGSGQEPESILSLGELVQRLGRGGVGLAEILDSLAEVEAALDRFQTEGHSDDTGAVALRPALAGAYAARAGEHASVGAGESVSG